MSADPDPAALLGRTADPRLLERSGALLPAELGDPPEVPTDPGHRAINAVGVTLTGTTLVLGIALLAFGVIGGHLLAIILGGVLVATHWGWVHVSEMTAITLSGHRNRELVSGRDRWLAAIEPYTRYRVTTEVADDGTIEIQRIAHRPVLVGSTGFTFEQRIEEREHHDADTPGAVVTERAELLRHWAATDTERERERYRAAADAYSEAGMRDEDEASRRAAARAASQALSDQINANLKNGPLSG